MFSKKKSLCLGSPSHFSNFVPKELCSSLSYKIKVIAQKFIGHATHDLHALTARHWCISSLKSSNLIIIWVNCELNSIVKQMVSLFSNEAETHCSRDQTRTKIETLRGGKNHTCDLTLMRLSQQREWLKRCIDGEYDQYHRDSKPNVLFQKKSFCCVLGEKRIMALYVAILANSFNFSHMLLNKN